MKVALRQVTVGDLVKDFRDDGEGGRSWASAERG